MGEITSIQIKKKTKEILDSLKLTKRESYNDVIDNLIEDSLSLNEETLEDIQKAMKEYEQGQFTTLKEAKQQLGL